MANSPIASRPVAGNDVVDSDLAADFRRVMGRFPTGVVVVSTLYRGKPYGMSVNSFASASLDPVLLMFCVAHTSGTWSYLRAVGRFAVSVLAADQGEACRVFATKGLDRFAELPWSLNRSGQPVLDDAIAWFDCAIADVFPAGDHEIVLGLVLGVSESADGEPLVFHRGRLCGPPGNNGNRS
jgi:flavin reductase (DIM6/NTAB) family NADH-FMN oxidoreductase RutF